jgi:hypothetical protein
MHAISTVQNICCYLHVPDPLKRSAKTITAADELS